MKMKKKNLKKYLCVYNDGGDNSDIILRGFTTCTKNTIHTACDLVFVWTLQLKHPAHLKLHQGKL